jgi:transposase
MGMCWYLGPLVYPDSEKICPGGWPTPEKPDSLLLMSGLILSPGDRAHLLLMMRRQTPSPVHRRMNALLLLDDGLSAEQVAKVLFIDAETVREHLRLYRSTGVTGIERLKYEGAEPALNEEQRAALGAELDSRLYMTAKAVRLRAADLQRGLHAARHGQGAEAAGIRLQDAEKGAGESERGRAAEVRGRGSRPIDEGGQ